MRPQHFGGRVQYIPERGRFTVSAHWPRLGMIERHAFLPGTAQPLAFALGHRWVIDPAHGGGGRARFTSRAPFPATSKAVEGARFEVHAKSMIAGAAGCHRRTRHALLNRPMRANSYTELVECQALTLAPRALLSRGRGVLMRP